MGTQNIIILIMQIILSYGYYRKITIGKRIVMIKNSEYQFLDPNAGKDDEGFDCRNAKIEENAEELYMIKKDLEMKRLLKLLTSKNVSKKDKMDFIKKYGILEIEEYKVDLHKGGLLDDWDFNIIQ